MQHLSHQQYLVGAQEWQGKTEAQGAMAGAAILLRIPCFRLFRYLFFAVNLFRSCLAQSCDVMGLFQCYALLRAIVGRRHFRLLLLWDFLQARPLDTVIASDILIHSVIVIPCAHSASNVQDIDVCCTAAARKLHPCGVQ